MDILKLHTGDILELKKVHPCGTRQFRILRVGSDVRIVCCGCGRDLVLDRLKLERAVKRVVSSAESTSDKHPNETIGKDGSQS